MSYPSKTRCTIKQEECKDAWKLNRFGFCAFSKFENGQCYCIKHLPCRCPFIWLNDSIWRYIDG